MTVHAPHTLEVIEQVSRRLSRQHAEVADATTVHALVLDSFRRYRHLDHPSNHTRALAAQLAADRLEAMRWSARQDAARAMPPSFLFVCSGNAGRSQLAAGLLRAAAPLSTRVLSAGDHPAARVLPAVIESLDELGIPLVAEYPKPVTPEFIAAADHIVTLGCDDPIEGFEGRTVTTWTFAAETTSGRQGVRHVRDQVAERVLALAVAHGIAADQA